jgi:nicotinate phosphoribosyltransferase
LEAFERYADALPANCIFLVDTYDTLDGVRHAAQVGQRLRAEGHAMLGIRLDSGDLGRLSRQARRILDEAGLSDAAIVASSDLDEYAVTRLLDEGARIDIWGVGTRLATAYDQPALGGIYKLAALQDDRGAWSYRLKLSEQEAKISDPGILQIRRFYDAGARAAADVIYDQATGIEPVPQIAPLDGSAARRLDAASDAEDLLVPVFRQGQRVYSPPCATEARSRTLAQLERFDPEILRLDDPPSYLVARESRLETIRQQLIAAARPR